jgi:hypothetical protein
VRSKIKPGHFAMEFFRGYNLCLEEEAERDVASGIYRAKQFENGEAYIDGWYIAAKRLVLSGWHHDNVSEKLQEL